MKSFIPLLLATALTGTLSGCSGGDSGSSPAPASDGADRTLTLQNTLTPGQDARCPNGGLRLDSGVDDDGDGALTENEFDETRYLCDDPIRQLDRAAAGVNVGNPWFTESEVAAANKASVAHTAASVAAGSAKNVILFIGDGMSATTVTATRIYAGQQMGMPGEEHQLSFEKFPFVGLAKTYNVDAQTPDSAGTMTAIMTGVKTDAGVVGVDAGIERGNCASQSGRELMTALELAEIAGKSTGIVSTTSITHATPAATYARSPERGWENIADMPQKAVDAGCEDIASQLVNFETRLEARIAGIDVDGIEVAMGGGRRHFLPADPAFNSPDAVSATEGDRTDGRDLIAQWRARYTNGEYVFDKTGFDAINTETTVRLLGLFNESHMQYEADRHNDVAGEPSLTEMTLTAINILNNNSNGFFLMVESGRIDHAHHAGNAAVALIDTREFARAVEAAVNATDPADTLIIVTADHGHVFTMAGDTKRGNPILGKVVSSNSGDPALAADELPYTTLGYTNGRGFRDFGAETNADVVYATAPISGRVDLTGIDTRATGFHQETLVPLAAETHSGDDVGVYATGPGSHLVTGTNEQHLLFHVMNHAAGLVAAANSARN